MCTLVAVCVQVPGEQSWGDHLIHLVYAHHQTQLQLLRPRNTHTKTQVHLLTFNPLHMDIFRCNVAEKQTLKINIDFIIKLTLICKGGPRTHSLKGRKGGEKEQKETWDTALPSFTSSPLHTVYLLLPVDKETWQSYSHQQITQTVTGLSLLSRSG